MAPEEHLLAPALLERFRRGDEVAFLELYGIYAREMRLLVGRFFPSPFEREEATQEIWLQVHRMAAMYDPTRGAPLPWLRALAVNRCKEILRARGRRIDPQLELDEATAGASPDAATDPHLAAQQHRLQRAIERFASTLASDEAGVLRHSLLEDRAHEEVAQMIGISVRRCKYLRKKLLLRAAADVGLAAVLAELPWGDPMSLWRNRRAIARAVAGELPAAAERTLRAHVAGCAACRAYYDRLAVAALALAPAATQRHERLRLQVALDQTTQPARTPAPAGAPVRRLRWLWWTPLLLAPVAALFVLVRPARTPSPGDMMEGTRPPPAGEIAWRGPADAPATEIGLLVYAGRRADGGVTPVRLVADFPGSGEGKLHLDDYVQFSVRGLRQASYVTIAGLDERGEVHVYAPRPDTPARPVAPDAKPVTLGPSIDLSVKHHTGRLRLFAVATPAPVGEADVTAAVRRAGFSGALALPGTQAAGLLAITP